MEHFIELRALFTCEDGAKFEMKIHEDYKDKPSDFIEKIVKSSDEVVKGEFLEVHTYYRTYGEFSK